MTVNSDEIEAQNLIQSVGDNHVNNAWIAGRMPPDTCCGLHPSADPDSGQPGFYDVYAHAGDLMAILKEQLGEPMANPTLAFDRVASVTAPGFAETYDNNLTFDTLDA